MSAGAPVGPDDDLVPEVGRDPVPGHVQGRQRFRVERGEHAVALADVEVGLAGRHPPEPGAHHARRDPGHGSGDLSDLGPRRQHRHRDPRLRPGAPRARRRGRGRSPTKASASIATMAERTFIKFTFLKIDPAWQRREGEQRAQDKREMLAACEDYAVIGRCGPIRRSARAATPTC